MNSEMELAARLKALEARIRELERVETGRFSGARAFNSAAQTVATSSETALLFDSEEFDTDDYHSTATNTSRLTIPVSGYYSISGSIRFDTNTTGYRQISIRADGTNFLTRETASPVSGTPTRLNIGIVACYLAAGSFVELMALQNSGGDLGVGIAGALPTFEIARLG